MRTFRITLSALLALLPLTLSAQEIRDMDIRVEVTQNGSATVITDWDVTVVSGTEWYIPIENLGPMTITSLQVFENGEAFVDEGPDWKSKRSLEEKAGRSGLVKTKRGYELCWGQGSLGDHKWQSRLGLTGLVQGMMDYDGFNFQFVNDRMQAPPKHVRVILVNKTGGPAWTPSNTKVWAFGFKGKVQVVDGAIVAETTKPLKKENHVTLMVRFDKGMFFPKVLQNIPFSYMEKKAKKGSRISNAANMDELAIYGLIAVVAAALVWLFTALKKGNKYNKKLLGVQKIKGWSRDVPLDGNLFANYYVSRNANRFFFSGGGEESHLMGALFLKWILEGKVQARKKCMQLQQDVQLDNEVEESLYKMALEAAGDNHLLEPNEFEKWADTNYKTLEAWPKKALSVGRQYLLDKGYLTDKDQGTEAGFAPMRQVPEFRQFLKDFTLINKRTVPEVHLWNQYLVYAALFGIADEVAGQMQALYPMDFARYAQEMSLEPSGGIPSLLNLSQNFSSIASRVVSAHSTLDSDPEDGFSFLGGGGGHSGGGHGGGSR